MKVLLNLEDLAKLGIPYSRMNLWRMARTGRFPKPLKIGPNRIAWLQSEVDAWLAQKAADRSPVQAEVERELAA